MTRSIPVVAGVVLGLVLAGCGNGETGDTAAPPEPNVTSPVTSAVTGSPAAPAPDGISEPPVPADDVPELLRFEAKTIDGEVFEGKTLYGSPAVLWFWAPWCPNCQAEASTIADVAGGDGVRFVGVAAQDQVPAMRDFVDRFGLGSFPHLADTSAEVWQRFGVTYQPAYAFVDSSGAVEVETDQLDADELRDRVRALR
ncbi:redoxin domain-containing protein [Actinophytocola gossypii]|uniref:Redoxin domain-containing protein n=1 Tax=Actinophytocola gossypii TaxID=2812003 RepID=A0ABT2JFY4_9PSEU|nr:redoxin domain-containing protein [Actinophytocola gossypii]MCT2586768.1 redoxin domain-containing protein [Actinophytocola gossypii]